MKRILLISLFVLPYALFSQITVDGSLTAQELVEDVLIGNPNFMVTNANLVSGFDFGSDISVGEFDDNGTGFPFSGIVLTSGSINDVPGPNLVINSAGGIGWPGDSDLEAITGVGNTNNASNLSFDFVAAVAQISMEIIMASEEYNQNFECTFADTFAIILTDNSTSTTQNIALVPNTSQPIQVINVHPEVSGQCSAINEAYFDLYNFEPFNPAANALIDFNGQTATFMVLGDLVVGNSYTMKIVIADASDTSYDSVLFVRGDSFGAFPIIEEEPEDIVVVDPSGDGLAIFNLTVNEALILGSQDPSTFEFTYFTSAADAAANINAISIPEAYQNTSNPQQIYFRMTNVYTNAHILGDFQIRVVEELGVDDVNTDLFEMYPNPATEIVTFSSQQFSSEVELIVLNISGQHILSETKAPQNNSFSLDVSSLDSGLYFVQIASEGKTITKKLIKK